MSIRIIMKNIIKNIMLLLLIKIFIHKDEKDEGDDHYDDYDDD